MKKVLLVLMFAWILVISANNAKATDISTCTSLDSPGTYNLTANIIDASQNICINITSSDVIFDGGGYTVDGARTADSYGVYAHNITEGHLKNVTIRNVTSQDWKYGIVFFGVNNSVMEWVKTNYTDVDSNGLGIYVAGFDDRVSNFEINKTGYSSGHGMIVNSHEGAGAVPSRRNVLENFTIKYVGDIAVHFISSDNIARNGDIYYAGRALGSAYADKTQNNTFHNITVHIMRYSTPGSYHSVIDLGELAGNTYPIKIYNCFFNRSGPSGNVGFIEGNGDGDFNTTKTSGTNIVGGPYIGGNYWANRSGTEFSDICTDSDEDGICDSVFTFDGHTDYLPLTITTSDSTPPNVTIYSPLNQTYYQAGNYTLYLRVGANETVNTWWYKINSLNNVTFTPNTTITVANGTSNITVYANDSSNNVGQRTVWFTLDATDYTPPTITIYAPSNKTYYQSNTTISLNVDANETIDTWWYSANGGNNITFTPNTTFTAFNGSNNITVWANDSVGNENHTIRYFTLDATDYTPPDVTVYSPQNITYYQTGNYTLYLRVGSNEAVDTWWYSLNSGSNITFTPNTTITAVNGSNNVMVYANDSSNNIGSETVWFTLDATDYTPPNATVLNITFEPPTYSTGDINGQDSWVGQPNADVQNSVVHWGSQALQIYDPDTGFDYAYRDFTNTTSDESNVTVYFRTTSTDRRGYIVTKQGSTTITQINFGGYAGDPDQQVVACNLTGVFTYSSDTWYKVTTTHYFSTDEWDLWIDDSKKFSHWAFCNNAAGMDRIYFATSDTPSGYTIYYDDLTVSRGEPKITIYSPQNITYYQSDTNVSLNVDADRVINTWWYSLNGGNNMTFTPNITVTGVNGSNNITVWANDSFGNMDSDTVFFTIDTTNYARYTVDKEIYNSEAWETTSQTFKVVIGYVNGTINITDINATFVWNGTIYSYSTKTFTTSQANFTRTLTIPSQTNQSDITFYWNLTIYYSDSSHTYNQTYNRTQTVYEILLTNCSASSESTTETLHFYLMDEINSSYITGDLEITFDISDVGEYTASKNISFDFTNQTNYSVCIFPSHANYTAGAMASYEATGYNARNYYLDDAILTNASATVNLYLLVNTSSTLIVFYTMDHKSQPITNVIIKVQKYYVGTNSYKTIAMTKSDEVEGKGASYLEKYKYYKYILERSGEVLHEFGNSYLTDDTVYLIVPLGTRGEWYSYVSGVGYSCSFNNATNVFSCTVTDTSGLMRNACLRVKQNGSLGSTDVSGCEEDNCVTSTASTLICSIGTPGSNTYWYTLWLEYPETDYILAQGTLDFSVTNIYGATGIMLALMIILVMSFIGIYTPETTILMSMFGVIISTAMGLIAIQWASVTSLCIAGSILVYRMRK